MVTIGKLRISCFITKHFEGRRGLPVGSGLKHRCDRQKVQAAQFVVTFEDYIHGRALFLRTGPLQKLLLIKRHLVNLNLTFQI